MVIPLSYLSLSQLPLYNYVAQLAVGHPPAAAKNN